MAEAIKVGLVGARFAAQFHWEGLRRVYAVPMEVVGVASKSFESAEEFAQSHSMKAFASFDALCDAVDVVDLCTPPSTHEPMAVAAFKRGKHVIIEKPFTGYFGPGTDDFRGNAFSKEVMFRETLASCDRILEAAHASGKQLGYAENFIYAPAVAKEREIVAKSGAQILWMMGECSHSGSHSPYYGIWKFSGGGSLVGKGCHPLSALLHLKRVEGEARDGKPIRPATVSGRTHEITRLANFRDAGFLRTTYEDIEDYGQVHVTFADGTVADVLTTELVLGGVHNWLEVFANNHRTRCNLNPVNALETYNPREDFFQNIYVMEKLSSKQGWSNPAADEGWQNGHPQEFQDFIASMAANRSPLSSGELARDTMAVLYAAYLSAERRGAEVEIPL
jgi:predicted dehydrogenase